MIWRWLIASILGFLSVQPLARYLSTDLPSHTPIWKIAILICFGILGVNWLIQYAIKKRNLRPTRNFFSLIFASINFFGVMLASVSFGFAQYFTYQNTLIREPITVTATIRSPKISDTVNLTAKSDTNPATKVSEPMLIGTGYQRQVWQVLEIKPFADNNPTLNNPSNDSEFSQNSVEDVTHKVPFNVLATANLNKNPDWLGVLNTLQPNQTLTVKLAIEPIIQPALVENQPFKQISLGFNEAVWLRQGDIQAKAQVLEINPKVKTATMLILQTRSHNSFLDNIKLFAEHIRWQLRQKMLSFLQAALDTQAIGNDTSQTQARIQASAILLSLLTGDSGLLTTDIKQLYQVTGISHLLAISGPHVMMLASIVAFILVALVKLWSPKILFRVPAQLLLLWTSVVVSFGYALLVGFELPAQRTVWMLLLVTLSVQWLLPISGYRVLAWVGLGMVWLDTTAVMQAGFWLSFVAVGLLVHFSQTFDQISSDRFDTHLADDTTKNYLTASAQWFWHAFKQLLLLQVWLFVLMLPVVVWFFGKISLVSIAVNLLAVPFLGLIIVPLDMLAGLLAFLPFYGKGLSESIWQLLSSLLAIFHQFLHQVSEWGFAKQVYVGLSNSQLILLGVAILLVLLPRRVVPKLLSLPVILAVVAVGYHARHVPQNPQLIVLDDTRLSVNLWINGEKSWLIVADNRFVKNEKSTADIRALPTADILENKIFPLMAKYHITQLAGVVSQTPSVAANDLIQQLAKTTPVQNYWLAGFNPLDNHVMESFNSISPQTCQVGKKSELGEVEAITGWQLDEQQMGKLLDEKEKWQTQTCLIRLQSSQKSAILMAGDSDIPMQMSHVLCQVLPANMLISPAVTLFTQDWLSDTKPSQIHLLTSRYAHPSEESQFAIAGYMEDSKSKPTTANKPVNLVQSAEVGTVVYGF